MSTNNILYIYDNIDWAIYNVGILWINDNADFISFKDFNEKKVEPYNVIWYGYSTLYKKKPIKKINKKIVISVHDPIEILRGDVDFLSSEISIVTTTDECKELLKKKNINAEIIKTNSIIPIRNATELTFEKLKLLTINSGEKRKNNNKIFELFAKCEQLNILCFSKIGHDSLHISDYVKLIDSYNIYVCMSSFEGGPIPAMDAMARGCVILSTCVGQMPELIQNGENGFILNSSDEFYKKIMWINDNKEWLHQARIKSINILKEKRNIKEIREKVKCFIRSIQ